MLQLLWSCNVWYEFIISIIIIITTIIIIIIIINVYVLSYSVYLVLIIHILLQPTLFYEVIRIRFKFFIGSCTMCYEPGVTRKK